MRKSVIAKEIIESVMTVPLDNIVEPAPMLAPEPVPEKTFGIGPMSNPEEIPEEPKPLNEDDLAEIRVFKHKIQEVLPWQVQQPQLVCA